MEEFIKGSELVIIKDHIGHTAVSLLRIVMHLLDQPNNDIHLFCFEKTSNVDYPASLHNGSNLILHDFASDPLNWNNSCSQCNWNTNISSYVTDHVLRGNKNAIIVIDSLTPLLLHRGLPYTCKTLAALQKNNTDSGIAQVVCVLHEDMHNRQAVECVCSIATSVITMNNLTSTIGALRKKPTGKILRKKMRYFISDQYELECQDVILPAKLESDETDVDPTRNLTFNLSLTYKEKKDRSELVLPYTKQQLTTERGAGDGGQIYYQPDDADDFDEEDPDDDLDI